MDLPEERRKWIEALCSQNQKYEELLGVLFELAKILERDAIVEAFRVGLEIAPLHVDDCVVFDDISLKFDANDCLIDVFRSVKGTKRPAEIVIASDE